MESPTFDEIALYLDGKLRDITERGRNANGQTKALLRKEYGILWTLNEMNNAIKTANSEFLRWSEPAETT